MLLLSPPGCQLQFARSFPSIWMRAVTSVESRGSERVGHCGLAGGRSVRTRATTSPAHGRGWVDPIQHRPRAESGSGKLKIDPLKSIAFSKRASLAAPGSSDRPASGSRYSEDFCDATRACWKILWMPVWEPLLRARREQQRDEEAANSRASSGRLLSASGHTERGRRCDGGEKLDQRGAIACCADVAQIAFAALRRGLESDWIRIQARNTSPLLMAASAFPCRTFLIQLRGVVLASCAVGLRIRRPA